MGTGSARTDGRRNPAVRALSFDTDSEEDDDDDASQHQQIEVADVHNEPLPIIKLQMSRLAMKRSHP